MKLTKYRIVRDVYAGYEVQKWRIWFPFWMQCGSRGTLINTHMSVEKAKEFIEWHKKNNVVWEESNETTA
jgi:hypothetical protein